MKRAVLGMAGLLCLCAFPAIAQFTEWSAPVNLGPVVNSPYTDSCVSVSKNGLSLFFFSNRWAASTAAAWHLYVSQRASVDEPWGVPQEIVGFNDGYGASCPALSPDEHRLHFVSNRPGTCGAGDIWVSRRRDRRDDFGWGPPVNLGCAPFGPNSPQADNVPTVFEDEAGAEVMYFSSNRPGPPGSFSVYQSRMGKHDETFGPAMLVAELSSPGADYAAIRRDGLEAILGSSRPGGPGGGGDLWTATRESTSDPWTVPVLLPQLSTPAWEGGRMSFSFDGRAFYFVSDRPGGYGNRDLYVTTREKQRR